MWPTERRIMRAKKFLTKSLIKPGSLWIEFGAGYGTYILVLQEYIKDGFVIALELDPRRLKVLIELVETQKLFNVLVLRGDFHHPPLKLNSCDGVLMANALHFSPTPQKLIVRAHRILRKGGRLVIVEYSVSSPLPWIPYPVSKQNLFNLLETEAFRNIQLLTEDHRTYSVVACRL
ncbi:MAG: class I SAM-dependent methyltransferase [Candidatus Heimdallarchaeota archaeon]